MMLRAVLCLFLVWLADTLSAADIQFPTLKIGSKAYTNVTVLGVNQTDLYFRHEGGIENVRLKYLSPELQKSFRYDPVAAAAAEKRQALEESRYAESIIRAVEAEIVKRRAARDTLPPELVLAEAVSDRTLLNKAAPELAVEKWLTDKPTTRDKFLLVSFWTTRSAPCLRLLPELNRYHKKFTEKLVVIGLSSETQPQVEQLAEPKIEFFSAIDTKKRLSNLVGVTSIPYVLFIDPRGVVRYQGHPAALNERVLQAFFERYTAVEP